METTRLGQTGLAVTRTAFGALPIQRVNFDVAREILHRAVDGGINFIDTARAYSDSEAKLGYALGDRWDGIVLATKAHARTGEAVLESIETSLANLKRDVIDVIQLHNPDDSFDVDAPDDRYDALLRAKEQGKVRHLGITLHKIGLAEKAVVSGLFETLQYPISALSSERELALVELCRKHDVGLIAMKAMCGGLLRDAGAAFAFLRQYENVVPIWGIQRMEELEEFLALEADPPAWDEAMRQRIEVDRAELGETFCRGCGYCLPCPVDIPIPMAARMKYLLGRAVTDQFLTEQWRAKMELIEKCTHCRQCTERCPYDLDAPEILRTMLEDYRAVYNGRAND